MNKLLLLTVFMFILISCKKDSKPILLDFPWLSDGNKLTYNYYSKTDTIIDAAILSITESSSFRLKVEYTKWTAYNYTKTLDTYSFFR